MVHLTVLHRKHGIMSSGLLFTFWLVLVLCSIPNLHYDFRHYNWQISQHGIHKLFNYQFISFMIFFPMIIVQLIINCFADRQPIGTEFGHIRTKNRSPELLASFISRTLFVWFNTMTRLAFRKTIELDDIWDCSPENLAQEVNPVFDKAWLDHVLDARNRKKDKDLPGSSNV